MMPLMILRGVATGFCVRGSEQEYEETAKPWLSALKAGLTIYPGHNDSYALTGEVKERYGL